MLPGTVRRRSKKSNIWSPHHPFASSRQNRHSFAIAVDSDRRAVNGAAIATVVGDLLDHAKKLCRFELTKGAGIPAANGVADFVCFFSVFTHLLHADIYRYLREAWRVLRPEGIAVFSFLEFKIDCHWNMFISAVDHALPGEPMNQFIDRDAITQWAAHLDFEVVAIWDGDRPHIPIPERIVWEGGQEMEGHGSLGQSVAVLRKNTVTGR